MKSSHVELPSSAHDADRDRSALNVPGCVYMDCSYSISSGKSSGVERVVRNLQRHLGRVHQRYSVPASSVIEVDNRLVAIDGPASRRFDSVASAQADLRSKLPVLYKRFFSWLCAFTKSRRLRNWFLPDAGHLGIFKVPHRWWLSSVRGQIARQQKPLELAPGDMLILPDAYWTCREFWPAIARARAAGVFVVVVVYDLIPITHTQFVGQRGKQRFTNYIRHIAHNADLIMTISQTVCDEVSQYLPELMGNVPHCRHIRAFPLGAEFNDANGSIRAELVDLFGVNQVDGPYLTVSAFDPRKNHEYLLDAFDRLWQTHPGERLCLVGRVGSRCEQVMERIRQHPRLDQQLFTFHDLSDAELQYCYRRAKGVIFPSIVEGFGLPIVESLWHKQRTFASDTPIHREVGGDSCEFFDLNDPQALVDLLVQWGQDCSSAAPIIGSEPPLTWAQSFDCFIDTCLAEYQPWSRLQSNYSLRKTAGDHSKSKAA